MMLREVLLKEDLHHMMSIDDGNFPGDDIIPMSQIFTSDEEMEEKEQEKMRGRRPAAKRKPGRVRLPGMRFPPDKKRAPTTKPIGETKTRKKAAPAMGRPSFNTLFKRQKAKQAKVKATEESIEKIIALVATDDEAEDKKEGVKTTNRGEEGQVNEKLPEGESDVEVTKIANEYEVMVDGLKPPTVHDRRDEDPPPYKPLPTSLPPSHSTALPNLFDADWLLQMEQVVDQTASHLTPDPMAYLR